MVALLYSLAHNISVQMQSGGSIFANKGWTDFFEPCILEKHYPISHLGTRYLPHPPIWLRLIRYPVKRIPILSGLISKLSKSVSSRRLQHRKKQAQIDFVTSDIFNEARDFLSKNRDTIFIPSLHQSFCTSDLLQMLVNEICIYNQETKHAIDALIEPLALPSRFVALQIRRGDKFREANLHSIEQYFFKVLPLLKEHRNVFIASDDYAVIQAVKEKYKDIHFFTLVQPDEKGFYIKKFAKQSPDKRKQEIIKLLAYTECFCRAENFVGTSDSNPFAFVAMKRNNQDCIDVLDRDFKSRLP